MPPGSDRIGPRNSPVSLALVLSAVRRRNMRLRVKPLCPDRHHVIAGPECFLSANLHAERIDQRHGPQVSLRCTLKEKLVFEHFCRRRRRPIFSNGKSARVLKRDRSTELCAAPAACWA